MRRSRLALSSSLAAIGLSASIALAQQLNQGSAPSGSPPSSDDSVDPSMPTRPTRYLLRNGLDYLAYREYARALSFFRAVESRQADLNEVELQQLKKGIAKAQQGMREAINGTKAVAQSKGRPTIRPGAFALAKPPKPAGDSLQLTSAEMPAPPTLPPADGMPGLPDPSPAAAELTTPSSPGPGSGLPVFGLRAAARPAIAPAPETPSLPEPAQPPAAVELPSTPPTADPATLPARGATPLDLPPTTATPTPVATEPPPPLVLESTSPTPVELPPTVVPSPVELPPTTSPPVPMPAEPALPTLPPSTEPAEPATVPPRVAVARRPEPGTPGRPAATDIPAIEPPPAAEAPPAPGVGPLPMLPGSSSPGQPGEVHESILSPRLAREVEQIAQRPLSDEAKPGNATDPTEVSPLNQGSPRLELPRAPSPTEARPLRRIPVPEEFVPLGKREWEPNRKLWAAAGTCHMILYFQDPVLERYGQGVEQSLGPIGRYFSYPLDDPRQSNQRNQILQPFYSMGKFAFQVGTLPYKLIVDPPWESEYDLGYYRPGDRIPADTIMITPTGVGPPLKGRKY